MHSLFWELLKSRNSALCGLKECSGVTGLKRLRVKFVSNLTWLQLVDKCLQAGNKHVSGSRPLTKSDRWAFFLKPVFIHPDTGNVQTLGMKPHINKSVAIAKVESLGSQPTVVTFANELQNYYIVISKINLF